MLTVRPVARLVAAGLVAGVLAAVPLSSPVGAAPATPSARGTDVVSRAVTFDVVNTNGTNLACSADNQSYELHGSLVGPRHEVLSASAPRINVLVHDLATGSWSWHLRRHPGVDYARKLAQRGETSLVLDRLGYGRSPLPDGNATCLGAQADMLHQVVQHLRSGHYDFSRHPDRGTPAAEHVVVHGHSTGAAIAELEAGTYDDIDGLVVMSWTDRGASQRALDAAQAQSSLCLKGQDHATFGGSKKDYRSLLFASAARTVQRDGADLRAATPCGDALSLSQMVASAPTTTRKIEAPVLLLFGGKDALNRRDARQTQVDAYDSSTGVTHHTVKGAGSALALEASAARTRSRVLHWLHTLD
ncbi:alpha/beta fold hydrolase [Nocardioides sp. KIGAM211]|uniref:Alpha/beta fold hydrolase n=1 Tax=Nocardioides luti TaxID=2761101 RepID=A0A7X0RLE4_9ACTN|nr:alpha/beta fold hydrolase [Nocardioides luti]MBB6629224.1 alpha/beta fold hydrolase [Nocardioides luti]